MRVFKGFSALPAFAHAAVTAGSFDGVHLGHRTLLERVVTEARSNGGESIVLTFDPHPRIALGKAEGLRLLTPPEEKTALFAALGIENVIVIPFDRAFSALSGREFVEQYLVRTLGAETLVAGYDHRFGHDRIGAEEIAAQGLIRVVRVDERRVGGEKVSSTIIRRLLDEGRRAEAERLLGHDISSSIVNDES